MSSYNILFQPIRVIAPNIAAGASGYRQTCQHAFMLLLRVNMQPLVITPLLCDIFLCTVRAACIREAEIISSPAVVNVIHHLFMRIMGM